MCRQPRVDGFQEETAPFVERRHCDIAAPGDHLERRVDEAHVPPCVPTRVLVARRQQRTEAPVEGLDERLDGAAHVDVLHGALHRQPSGGRVGVGLHVSASSLGTVPEGPCNDKSRLGEAARRCCARWRPPNGAATTN